MKRFAATILLSAFFLHTVVMVAYVGYFYSFRSEIAAEYCINKEKKELDCRGCCHLTKTLSRINTGDDGTESTPVPVQESKFEWYSLGVVEVHDAPVFRVYLYPENAAYPIAERSAVIDTPPPRC